MVTSPMMDCVVPALCNCERNPAVFVPCAHAVCASPRYHSLVDKGRYPMCRQVINKVFTPKDLEMPSSMSVLIAVLLK